MPSVGLITTANDRKNAALQPLAVERTALVVVDIQEKLLPPIHEKERLLRNAQLLLRLAGVLNLPVLATTQYAKGLGPTVPQVAELFPASTQPMDKLEFGCFGNEAFCGAVRDLGHNRDALLVCGMETHICVLQTVLGALKEGYAVHVAADACGSRPTPGDDKALNWRLGLERMRDAGAVISSTEAAIYELLRGSGTAEFKRMLAYLK
ncbi:MAG: hydrolase [Candidatus Koribacter versatilis]|uniref:Hydrolase n=1 Tax=Candidatus Korobacter versatilis TaxID=658062 RepID=A0A932A6R1_9BACT|nr:hydrolase [Candidatus Koribacter versatilis]